MKRQNHWPWLAMITLVIVGPMLSADDTTETKEVPDIYPVAVFPFRERGRDVEGMGNKVTDLLFANLASDPTMYLVEREDLNKLIEEQELNLSGIVNPNQATEIAQLTGAKILVTGSVLQVGEKLYVVAKIIGTETSRVVGASVKGNIEDDLDGLVVGLAEGVSGTIVGRADELVANPPAREDRIVALRKSLRKRRLPTVMIVISERHIGQIPADPAAETEIGLICKDLGLEVMDSTADKADIDVLLTGEGFSQFATRHGNLVSVKARLELKALDRESGRLLAVERQTTVAVDLAEQIAAKSAIEEAAAKIAERILPKIAGSEKQKSNKKARN